MEMPWSNMPTDSPASDMIRSHAEGRLPDEPNMLVQGSDNVVSFSLTDLPVSE